MALSSTQEAGPSSSSSMTTVGLVAGRSKRSTAGNRMRALLDQQHHLSASTDEADEIFREEENDDEFAAPQREEEDVFDSDFGDSSDEDQDGQAMRKGDDESEGERELQAEEERRRKAARKNASRLAPSVVRRPTKPRPPPSALPSQRTEEATDDAAAAGPSRSSRRISFAPDVRNGAGSSGAASSRRISSRRATVQAGLDSQVRIEEAEARRLQHPNVRNPPSNVKKPSLNQAELIELALEREEENRRSLKEWMEVEEERKRKELLREKRTLPSSWIRWRSIRSTVAPDPPIAVLNPQEESDKGDIEKTTSTAEVGDGEIHEPPIAVATEENLHSQEDVSVPADVPSQPSPASPLASSAALDFTLDPVLQARKEAAARAAKEADADASARAVEGGETSTGAESSASSQVESRSLVSLHYTSRPAPPWPEQWSSLLGSHTDWATTYVVPARNRPSKPRASLCAITGKMARYRDAKTGIPFADVEAARILRTMDEEQWEWCEVDIDSGQAKGSVGNKVNKGEEGQEIGEDTTKKVKKGGNKKIADGSGGGDGYGKTGFWILAQDRLSGRRGMDEPSVVSGGESSVQPTLKRKASVMKDEKAASIPVAKKTGRGSTATTLATSTPPPRGTPQVEEAPPHLAVLGVAPGDEQAILARALALPSGTTRSGRGRSSLGGASKATVMTGGGDGK